MDQTIAYTCGKWQKKSRSLCARICQPGIEGRQRSLALQAVAGFFVANLLAHFFFQRLQQVEGHIGRLEVLGVGMGDVMHQRAEAQGARRGRRLFSARDFAA